MTPNTKEKVKKIGSVADFYEGDSSPFMCPVTSLPMNGRYKFSFIKTCGCVFAEKTFKEVSSSTCLLVRISSIFCYFPSRFFLTFWVSSCLVLPFNFCFPTVPKRIFTKGCHSYLRWWGGSEKVEEAFRGAKNFGQRIEGDPLPPPTPLFLVFKTLLRTFGWLIPFLLLPPPPLLLISNFQKPKKRKQEEEEDVPLVSRPEKRIELEEKSQVFKSLFRSGEDKAKDTKKGNLYMGTFTFYPGQ